MEYINQKFMIYIKVYISGTIQGVSYGIWNAVQSHNYTFGDSNSLFTIETPVILEEIYGIYFEQQTTYNFYNGIMKGTESGYNIDTSGAVNYLPGFSISTDTETIDGVLYKTAYLEE